MSLVLVRPQWRLSGGWPRRVAVAVSLCCVSVGVAQAQPVLLDSDASEADIKAALFAPPPQPSASRGLRARAFAPTLPPNQDGLCKGAGATAASDPATAAGGRRRNLEVVPYDPQAASLNLKVSFLTDSANVEKVGGEALDKLARVMRESDVQPRRFVVAGHTDGVGQDDHNLRLSCARSIAVRKYLIDHGVEPERLSAYGFGASHKLENTSDESALNRRVEVKVAP